MDKPKNPVDRRYVTQRFGVGVNARREDSHISNVTSAQELGIVPVVENETLGVLSRRYELGAEGKVKAIKNIMRGVEHDEQKAGSGGLLVNGRTASLYQIDFIFADEGGLNWLLGSIAEYFPRVPVVVDTKMGPVDGGDEAYEACVQFVSEHMQQVIDFGFLLGLIRLNELGYAPDEKVLYAEEMVEGSGVFLSQGSVFKEYAMDGTPNVSDRRSLFGPEGLLYVQNETRMQSLKERRQRQFELEETLYNYVGFTDHKEPALGELIVALQEDVFGAETYPPAQEEQNVPDNNSPSEEGEILFRTGIRKTNVEVSEGGGCAPDFDDVPQLLDLLNSRFSAIWDELPAIPTYEQKLRVATTFSAIMRMIHPLEDGNTQSSLNMLSAILFCEGEKRVYIQHNVMFNDEMMPDPIVNTNVWSLPGRSQEENDNSVRRSSQRVAALLSDDYWPLFVNFLREGGISLSPEIFEANSILESTEALATVTCIQALTAYLDTRLYTEPFGSTHMSSQEIRAAAELVQREMQES